MPSSHTVCSRGEEGQVCGVRAAAHALGRLDEQVAWRSAGAENGVHQLAKAASADLGNTTASARHHATRPGTPLSGSRPTFWVLVPSAAVVLRLIRA